MLPLPDVEVHAPTNLDEALSLLRVHRGSAKIVAGGTDLLPNMKHGVAEPRVLILLRRITELAHLRSDDDGMHIGALTSLATLAEDERLARYPSVQRAAALIASPQIREMATLGGNLCLDTRCVYFNQTHFWRSALGHCLKKNGTECHVIKGAQRCVAAASADLPPVLISLGASVRIVGSDGIRTVPLSDLYRADGVAPIALPPDEILVEVLLPPPHAEVRSTYEKLRIRRAIDFPLLGLALSVRIDDSGVCRAIRVVANCIAAAPRVVALDALAVGHRLDARLVGRITDACVHALRPLPNIAEPEWRREMVPVLVRRAFRTVGLP